MSAHPARRSPARLAASATALAAARASGASLRSIFAVMALLAVVMLYPFYFMMGDVVPSREPVLTAARVLALVVARAVPGRCRGREMLNSTIVCARAIVIILVGSTAGGLRVREAALPDVGLRVPAWSSRR